VAVRAQGQNRACQRPQCVCCVLSREGFIIMQASTLAASVQEYNCSWLRVYTRFKLYPGRRILQFVSLPSSCAESSSTSTPQRHYFPASSLVSCQAHFPVGVDHHSLSSKGKTLLHSARTPVSAPQRSTRWPISNFPGRTSTAPTLALGLLWYSETAPFELHSGRALPRSPHRPCS
jgi:hypothetical protein